MDTDTILEIIADLAEKAWTVSPLSMLRCSLAVRAYARLGQGTIVQDSTTTPCPSNPITHSDSKGSALE